MITQLFQIPGETWHAMSNEETLATYDDMVELGIAQPPYPELTVALPCWSCFQIVNEDGTVKPWPKDEEGRSPAYFHFKDGEYTHVELPKSKELKQIPNLEKWLLTEGKPQPIDSLRSCGLNVMKALVVLLATRNAVKTTTHNKLAKLGVGKQKAEYVTTITLGEIDEAVYEGGEPTGRTLRPHLRRGHIRRQHYGPNLAFIKKVFIQPVFVNADETFVNSRTAYNLSGIRKEPSDEKN